MANDFALPPGFSVAPPPLTMTPMNDIQVIALLAAAVWPHLPASMATAAASVDFATELLAESVLRAKVGGVMARVRELEAATALATH